MDRTLAAFVALTFLLAVTPGISTAVVVRNVLERGARAGYAAAAGAAAANATWATGAAFGLSALVGRAPAVLDIIRIAGVAFLVFLALNSLRRAVSPAPGELRGAGARSPGSSRAPFLEGFGANLLHPSIAVYYLSVVPSFLTTPEILSPRFVLLAAIHITMAFACHVAWGTGFHALRALWARPPVQRAVHAAIGIALLGLGALLLAD